MSKPYLDALTAERTELRGKVEAVRTKIVAEKRPMTEVEKTETEGYRARVAEIEAEIPSVSEEMTRAASVDALSASLQLGATERPTPPADEHRSAGSGTGPERMTGNASTRDRDPGHYRSVRDGGERSFFADAFRAQLGDRTAATRIEEHHRALDTAGEGVGLVAPKWLTAEYEKIARQGRKAAAAVRHIDLGSDPRPMTMPKQTAGTDGVVADQANENDPVGQADAYDSDFTTVTPKVTSGAQNFSRQMFDMSDPAIDMLIYGDLQEVYDLKVEGKVCAAMLASAGAAVKTYATEAAWITGLDPLDDTFVGDAVVDTQLAVRKARKLPANVIISSVDRYGSLLKIKDSTGRPLMPGDSGGMVNIFGQGEVATDGRFQSLPMIATDGITQYPESLLVARAQDTILFESALMRFRYEEVSGPETIRVGVWGYTATHVKWAGKSVKRIAVTSA